MPFSTPSVLRFFNFISFNRENDTKDVCRIDEPHSLPLLIAQGCRTIVQATLG